MCVTQGNDYTSVPLDIDVVLLYLSDCKKNYSEHTSCLFPIFIAFKNVLKTKSIKKIKPQTCMNIPRENKVHEYLHP